ncbi:hypothetical protein C453_05049 [Haloferax elongans ATCC BAA-1513]|uniref:Uncharacterized protein n=1 Tax=Haloferax elongans ATCC BAA-1513 TaxID=1230453 RepID=M0HVA5_HALEO|nr:hypothetical protein C453_05049 [Haloferax elongans ATCC BAA-1513]
MFVNNGGIHIGPLDSLEDTLTILDKIAQRFLSSEVVFQRNTLILYRHMEFIACRLADSRAFYPLVAEHLTWYGTSPA